MEMEAWGKLVVGREGVGSGYRAGMMGMLTWGGDVGAGCFVIAIRGLPWMDISRSGMPL